MTRPSGRAARRHGGGLPTAGVFFLFTRLGGRDTIRGMKGGPPMRRRMALLALVNVLWGMSVIWSKHALSVGFTAMSLAFARYVMAALCLLPIHWRREGRPRLRRGDVLPMALSGVVGMGVYYIFEYNGISRTSAISASLILGAVPILTMVAEAVLDRRALGCWEAAGALASVAGVALVVLSGADEGEASLVGDLFILGAAVTWVAYIFLSRGLRAGYSSLAMNTWQAMFAAASLAPMAALEGCDWAAIPWDGWACAFILAAVCSALCYFLYGQLVGEMSPLASAIFINLIPLTTMAGGVAFLGEALTWPMLAGGGLIIGGIFLVNAGGRQG